MYRVTGWGGVNLTAGAEPCVSGVCVRGEEMELQCMGSERCTWGRGVTSVGRDVAGNAIAGVLWVRYIYSYTHICVRGGGLWGWRCLCVRGGVGL